MRGRKPFRRPLLAMLLPLTISIFACSGGVPAAAPSAVMESSRREYLELATASTPTLAPVLATATGTASAVPSPTRTAASSATPTVIAATPTWPPAATPTATPRPIPAALPPTRATPSNRFAPSDVSLRTPSEVIGYLRGNLAGYQGSGAGLLLDFSPSDILETMDTAVVDTVQQQRGTAGVQQLYEIIARATLDSLREQYPDRTIVVPLEAGHGGNKGYYYDPGSEGTEARHTRGVAAAMARLAQLDPAGSVVVRPVHNDDIGEGFGLAPALDKPIMSRMLLRQARASMLAQEVASWNRARADAKDQAAVHEISIHFNAGARSAMVLHQGNTVRPELARLSIDFARRYLRRVVSDLNASQLLPGPLLLWSGTGLHDDVMMYRPAYLSDAEIAGITLRYSALQGGGYLTRYVDVVLENASRS